MTGAQGPPGVTGSQGQPGMTGSQGQQGMTGSPGQVVRDPGSTSLRDILFDYETTEIRPSEMDKISDVAVYLIQNPSVSVGLDGATDPARRISPYAADLGQRRVSNVRDALIRNGVAANRIEAGRFGAERLLCNDSLEACALQDGRVEILALRSN
jgi:peptidoglycan-associated lipoprotein